MAANAELRAAQRAADRAVKARQKGERALAALRQAEAAALAKLDALVHSPTAPAAPQTPAQPPPAPSPAPVPQPVPTPVPAAPVAYPAPPPALASLLSPVPTFDAVFKDGDTFPNATWETQWRDWGQGALQRRLQGGYSLAIYADKSIGVDPFKVTGGVLSIETGKLPTGSQPLGHTGGYYAGMLTTSASFKQRYGYFEVTMKAPIPPGPAGAWWPAVWLIGDDTGQEIDLNESYDTNIATVNQTIHGRAGGTPGNPDVVQGTWQNIAGADVGKDFVTFGALWDRTDFIQFYVNGQPTKGYSAAGQGWTSPMFFIVSAAVGAGPPGCWFGPPDPAAVWPRTMYVRSVRAWGLK